MIIMILAGSTINPCLHTTWPSKILKGTYNNHFFKFNAISYRRHVSKINHKLATWCFTSPNIVQSSKYTSKNLWMNSLNATMTMCEKIIDAFLSLKGITIYWKNPHSVAKFVLLLSSCAIFIWWYPDNRSVNEYASCPRTLSNTSSVNEVGKGSWTQALLSFLRSTQILISSFCFFS